MGQKNDSKFNWLKPNKKSYQQKQSKQNKNKNGERLYQNACTKNKHKKLLSDNNQNKITTNKTLCMKKNQHSIQKNKNTQEHTQI